jgi:hypothetical protein
LFVAPRPRHRHTFSLSSAFNLQHLVSEPLPHFARFQSDKPLPHDPLRPYRSNHRPDP